MKRCGICGRELQDKKSIERGFDPVCYKKYLEAKAEEDFEKKQIRFLIKRERNHWQKY